MPFRLGVPGSTIMVEAPRLVGEPGVEPAGCVVPEDSGPGVRAAISAGMRCIAIPYLLGEPLDKSFSSAHLLIGAGMVGLHADDVFSWIRTQG